MGRDLQLYKFTKNLQIVHLKWVNFMIYKLYLNEAVKDTITGIKKSVYSQAYFQNWTQSKT